MDEGGNAAEEAAAIAATRWLVARACSRAPIKRADLIKFISSLKPDVTAPEKTRILEMTSKMLTNIYGYKLLQINAKGSTQYILVLNNHSSDMHEPADTKTHAMLVVALAHIFMSGGSVKDDDLWKFMERAGLMKINDHNSRKIFTHQFTKELYLNYMKVGETDHSRYAFEWGERATAEFPKAELLKKISEAFERTPEHWCEQNKAAQESDKNYFS